ncbi:phosphate acyltransferase PlsX [Phocicoccus pinnipedialis]|uniref:Phosphate acyltransferase n=1 Tax=Phocicoccus pinnipedialis TaxID=110845 RepID=A0A6V7RGA6_9BACL|nr:phosphate acyltransferase PlsX [Jeotgalicoccus pinnipedialis]MBP1939085.1 glycerol-3-phosphate acyltransferase PlsX [Jeotgalicoccus pinnipedialis]CAD2076870.1 Phosphate acyltransferase [Jeotgalicoccus pinnipedialis]
MKTIAVDLMGGDNAPESIANGVIEAVNKYDDIKVLAYGLKGSFPHEHKRVKFIEVTEAINSEDDPVRSIRRKKDSSLVRAAQAVKDKEALAIVSAGNTGALLTAGLFVVGRIKGIERPAIASMIPTTGDKGLMLLDMGANSENKPSHLLQFAQMATIYIEAVEGRKNPTVGLVNNGSEEIKGTPLTKETYQLLKESNLNFQGFFETRDVLSGKYDIAVTDGFTGNIILKTIEGTSMSLLGEVKKIFLKRAVNKVAALVLKKDVEALKDMMDYRQFGGAPLLGLDGIVLKAHGSSDSLAIKNAIRVARKLAESNAIDKIKESIKDNV